VKKGSIFEKSEFQSVEKSVKSNSRTPKKLSWVARLRHMDGEALKKCAFYKNLILKDLNILEKKYKKVCKQFRNS
jgi:hypothetical protein